MAPPSPKKPPAKAIPPKAAAPANVEVDWNNPEFKRDLFALPTDEKLQVLKTVEKILQLSWPQLYRDQGLKWEKITSKAAPAGIESFYSLRINQGRRATAYRDGNFLRLLTIEPDHDATYGKK